MSHMRTWQALIGCTIVLAGLLGCQNTATKPAIDIDPTLWLHVSNIPGMPLPDQKIPPTEAFDVTRDGVVRRVIDGAARGSVLLPPAEVRELEQLISTVHRSSPAFRWICRAS